MIGTVSFRIAIRTVPFGGLVTLPIADMKAKFFVCNGTAKIAKSPSVSDVSLTFALDQCERTLRIAYKNTNVNVKNDIAVR